MPLISNSQVANNLPQKFMYKMYLSHVDALSQSNVDWVEEFSSVYEKMLQKGYTELNEVQ